MDRKTNWDEYYNAPFFLTKYTRKYAETWLIRTMKKYFPSSGIKIAELGGGDSCFFEGIIKNFNVSEYIIYDNNKVGIDKFITKSIFLKDKYRKNIKIDRREIDLSKDQVLERDYYDFVFSFGLIEHFDKGTTAEVIRKHFELVRDKGIVLISAPTPTSMYRALRKIAEILKIWRFYDERPIPVSELRSEVGKYGMIIEDKILWLIGLTQYAIIVRKQIL
jgi:hypothetical protein